MTDDRSTVLLDVPVLAQPDDVTCGPTCLTKVLGHHGDLRDFVEISRHVQRNPDGGTLGVYLGRAALALGYDATIYSYNLRVFDPTWRDLDSAGMRAKLAARAALKRDPRLLGVIEAYRSFLDEGGVVRLDDLDADLLKTWIARGRPIISGLSATYLYGIARDDPDTNVADDVGDEPANHFVVIAGYREGGRRFVVNDPY
ncbi:MAG: C39 family peptidase, partial [Sandaracinaceae bacterium]